MSNLIAIQPTASDIEQWSRTFVPELVLWWWDESPIPMQEQATRIVARSNLRNDPVLTEISYVNAFHTWVMPAEVKSIIIDDGTWLASLSDAARTRANQLQVQFGRGLCIPRHRFPTDLHLPDRVVSANRVVLDQSLWSSFPQSVRNSIIETELPEWDRNVSYPLPPNTPAHIAEIANTFVHQEGVNCLSVTAFAITADRADLEQWMFPQPFESILRDREYAPYSDTTPQPGNVIVYRNEENIVHAASALKLDRFLNKNGQTSFNPISIIDMEMLSADWENYSMSIYRQQ